MSSSSPKVLIYSHDSFGLGHLRRCRTIAHSLVGHNPDLSALILSGSPIIGKPLKDLRLSQSAALESGTATPLGAAATAAFQQLIENGFGDDDTASIIKLIDPNID